ncbi:MAG TPA: GumC family protein, partial [Terricaulis sp.]|nr:GumC family protein [Terricaulis sp.]
MNVMNTDPPSGHSPGHPSSAPQGLAEMFGVTAALQMLRRRLLIMIIVGAVAASSAFVYLMMQAPQYTAVSLVIINPRQEQVLSQADIVGQMPRDSSTIDSEIERLRSPALMGELAEALGLTTGTANGDAVPTQGIGGSIEVRRRGMTYVIEISARSTDPQRAQLIANTYADVYIASQVNARIDTAQRANSWLSRRLAELREDVQAKESAAENYRMQSGLLDAQGSSLAEQQITNVQTQVLQAQADLAEREARYRQLQELRASGAPLDAIGNAINSDTVRQLRAREAEIAQRQSELEQRYLDTHPAVQAVRAERADITQQIEREIQRISVNLGNEVSVARARLATLQNSMRAAAGDLNENSSSSVRLRELEREAAASRQVYEAYLQRYQGSAIADRLRND